MVVWYLWGMKEKPMCKKPKSVSLSIRSPFRSTKPYSRNRLLRSCKSRRFAFPFDSCTVTLTSWHLWAVCFCASNKQSTIYQAAASPSIGVEGISYPKITYRFGNFEKRRAANVSNIRCRGQSSVSSVIVNNLWNTGCQ